MSTWNNVCVGMNIVFGFFINESRPKLYCHYFPGQSFVYGQLSKQLVGTPGTAGCYQLSGVLQPSLWQGAGSADLLWLGGWPS